MIEILFPGHIYSDNKKEIAKLRTKYKVANWTGSSWSGPNGIIINTDFKSTAKRLGIPHPYNGDILSVSGDINFIKELIKMCEDFGATIEGELEKPVDTSKINAKIKDELEIERRNCEIAGLNLQFQDAWLSYHETYLRSRYL